MIVKHDWVSFATYANYVRRLFVDPCHVQVAIINEVLRSPYSKFPLLPNLERLALKYPKLSDSIDKSALVQLSLGDLAFARLFLSRSVLEIFIYEIPSNSTTLKARSYRLSNLIDDIISCSPNVKYLKLTSSGNPDQLMTTSLDHMLCTLFIGLRILKHVELSTCFFTSSVIHTLSLAPCLTSLSAAGLTLDTWGKSSRFTACARVNSYYGSSIPTNCWSQLTRYTAVTGARQLNAILQERVFLSHRITSLVVLLTSSSAEANTGYSTNVRQPSQDDYHGEFEILISKSSITSLLHTIVLNCHSLTKLYVDLNVPYLVEDDKELDNLPFYSHDLLFLKDVQNLEQLTIRDHRVLSISDNDLLTIISHLLRLEQLVLFHVPNWTPVVITDEQGSSAFMSVAPPRTPSTVHTISKILRTLPSLTCLGLYIDFSTMTLEDMADNLVQTRRSFLDILDLGHSPPPPPCIPSGFLTMFLTKNGIVNIGGAGAFEWGGLEERVEAEQEAWKNFVELH